MKLVRYTYLLFVLCFNCTYSQVVKVDETQIKLKSYFTKDTILIGQKIQYVLCVKSPINYQIVLPDSSAVLGHFTMLNVIAHPTYIQNDLQVDSVVYELTSFSLDTLQYLSCPVKVFSETDSILIQTQTDSIVLKNMISSSKMLTINNFEPLSYNFNYQIAFVLFIVFLLSLWLIRKYIWYRVLQFWNKLNQKNRINKKIIQQELLLQKFLLTKEKESLIEFITVWKSVMSEMLNKPISTYTSSEIHSIFNEEELFKALQFVDKAVYSNIFDTELEQSVNFVFLKCKFEFNKIYT